MELQLSTVSCSVIQGLSVKCCQIHWLKNCSMKYFRGERCWIHTVEAIITLHSVFFVTLFCQDEVTEICLADRLEPVPSPHLSPFIEVNSTGNCLLLQSRGDHKDINERNHQPSDIDPIDPKNSRWHSSN